MNKITLTDSEWKIMTLLWQKSPLTMRNIQDALYDETGWSKHTIISFLKRMLTKEAIAVEDGQPAKLYRPLLDEQQTIRQETQSMLSKLYQGDFGLMMSRLVEEKEFSDREIDEMMEILRQGKGR